MDEMNNYRLAVALLQFKTAYKNLTAASKELPDYDISDCYPFYLLDFETIESSVVQWCTLHASNLMKNLPDRVDNPACLKCPYFRAGIGADGQCKALTKTFCNIFPYIIFTREAIVPALTAHNVNIEGLNDSELHLLYMKKADDIYATKTTSHRDIAD